METNLSKSVDRTLRTSIGDFPLNEYCLKLREREWRILHVEMIMTPREELNFLNEFKDSLPYGVILWAASIALSHEIASRADVFRGKRILELGAGTGMPGIVASSHASKVIQTDRNELVMSVCKRNIELNDVRNIEQRIVDWTEWNDAERYDWILGSDILYGEKMHPHLRRIFETNLKSGGRILLSDPFRAESLKLLEALEKDGWTITITKWNIGEEPARPVGLFELAPPVSTFNKTLKPQT